MLSLFGLKGGKKTKRKSAKKSKPKRKSAKIKSDCPSCQKTGCKNLLLYGTPSQQKKYGNRPSPPFPGAICLKLGYTRKRIGNDNNLYKLNSSGRWIKIPNE